MPVGGTHLLDQVTSLSQVIQREAQYKTALAKPGVNALCLRVPWRNVETAPRVYDWSIFEAGARIAQSQGRKFYPRLMGGRHAPEDVIVGGPHYYFDFADAAVPMPPGGANIPLPCNPDGSTNALFRRRFRRLTEALAAWATGAGVDYLHFFWWGRLWAEIDLGADVTSQPGNTMANIERAHMELFDIAATSWPGLFEFPLSGHGPTGHFATLVTDRAASVYRDRVWFQTNGWGEWGVTWPGGATPGWATKVGIGKAYQAFDTKPAHDWTTAYSKAFVTAKATYVEPYLQQFTNAQLLAEAAKRPA